MKYWKLFLFISIFLGSIFPCMSADLKATHAEVTLEFSETITSKHLKLQRVLATSEDAVSEIAKSFGRTSADLKKILADQRMILWGIYLDTTLVGRIYLEEYRSLGDLKEQAGSQAEPFFKEGRVLELSYKIWDDFQRKGYGFEAVKAWVEDPKNKPLLPKIFAVVEQSNIGSIKILKGNEFFQVGSFPHPETKQEELVFIPKPKPAS